MGSQTFKELDLDEDGFVTAHEVPFEMWDLMFVYDVNADAKISETEFAQIEK